MTIKEYLTKLCSHVGLMEADFSLEIEETDKTLVVRMNIPETESGLFIGYHGETLQAIQRVVRIVFYDELKDKSFKLNVNDYREQREERLAEKTIGIARRVQKTAEAYTFPYLSAGDRYLVHTTIANAKEFEDLISESEGEGRYRYLTIRLKNKDE